MKTRYLSSILFGAIALVLLPKFVHAELGATSDSNRSATIEISKSTPKEPRAPIVEPQSGDEKESDSHHQMRLKVVNSGKLEDVLVPIGFFVFLIIVILGWPSLVNVLPPRSSPPIGLIASSDDFKIPKSFFWRFGPRHFLCSPLRSGNGLSLGSAFGR